MSTTTVEPCRLGGVQRYGKSAEDLFKAGEFPEKGVTLLELRQAYFDPSTGVRDDVHANCGKGEWVADVMETDGAKRLSNGSLAVVYVQRPSDIAVGLRSGAYSAQGGKRIAYTCPPNGWVVPGDGKLWHPETGAAIATINNREEAVKEVAKYIGNHPEEFANSGIPQKWHKEFIEIFGKRNFNPENPTPEQRAELETSYQVALSENTGLRAVGRLFWRRESGPFDVRLCFGPRHWDSDLGARLRRTE